MFAIFAAGVLTFASPCVLPLMPVYLATIAGGSLQEAAPRRTDIRAPEPARVEEEVLAGESTGEELAEAVERAFWGVLLA